MKNIRHRLTLASVGSHLPNLLPAPEPPPVETVAEAVAWARARFSAELVFGPDVEAGIRTVRMTAGPPAKVYRTLEGLALMVRAKREGLLKEGTRGWLTGKGFTCSGESQTVRTDFRKRRARTFHDGTRRRFFELHLKVSEATSPDSCVRIYFDWAPTGSAVVVGYVGRHPE